VRTSAQIGVTVRKKLAGPDDGDHLSSPDGSRISSQSNYATLNIKDVLARLVGSATSASSAPATIHARLARPEKIAARTSPPARCDRVAAANVQVAAGQPQPSRRCPAGAFQLSIRDPGPAELRSGSSPTSS